MGRIFDFLLSLKNVHIGPGTRFSFVYDYTALVIFGALVLAVIGYATYIPQAASPRKKKIMGVIRGLLLAVVLMLACRPQLIMEHEDRVRSVVAVWVDSSASMTLEDPYTGDKADPKMREYLQKITDQLKNAPGTAPASGDRSRLNRFELATTALADAKWLKQVTATQDVIFFTGSGRAEPVGIASTPQEVDTRIAQIKAHPVDGSTTDVPTVVRDILDRVQGQRLSAVVLLTDGQTTEHGSRLDQSAEMAHMSSTKIFSMPMGQEEEPFDLRITSPRIPSDTFSRDPVSARIHVVGAGITGPTQVRVSVYRKPAGDKPIDTSAPLATKVITLDPTKKEVDTDLPIKLKKTDPGKWETFNLVSRVDQEILGGGAPQVERDLKNNQKVSQVTVHDAQINVLYVDGYPRWEFRYLKNELIREPTVNVSSLLLSADAEEGFVQDADPQVLDKTSGEETFPGALLHFPDTPQDLNKYDVLLIGDVDSTYFSPAQQKLIIEWVRNHGGGVGFIAGPASNPESFRESELEVLLPVTPDEIDVRARVLPPSDNSAFNLTLTPAGKETNIFRFFDDPEQSWKQVSDLPSMYWFKPVQGLKPGAIVLATHPTRSLAGNPAPLLVMRQFGAGPVIFSAYADTWRWRRYTGEPLFQSYWLQMCRLLYANKALGQSKRIELLAESGEVEIGSPIKLSLIVKDPTLSGQIPSDVPVTLTDKDGKTIQTITLNRPAGDSDAGGTGGVLERLEGSATASQLGEFTLSVKPGVLPIDTGSIKLSVEQPQREFETVTADMTSLRSVATKTGGAVIPAYRAEDIAQDIPDRSMPVLHTESEELWSKPFALFLVLLLASTEWLVRKSAGLI